jgi:putative tricarboxylic transport membrane protein
MKGGRPRLPGEAGFGILLLAFSLLAFREAFDISGLSSISSAGTFPMAAAAAMAASRATRGGGPAGSGSPPSCGRSSSR